MRQKYKKENLINIAKIVFIPLLIIFYLIFYSIKVPEYKKYREEDLNSIYNCDTEALNGSQEQAEWNYYRSIYAYHENIHENYFWLLIYFENLKFKEINLSLHDGVFVLNHPEVAFSSGGFEINSTEEILLSYHRVQYWNHYFLENYLKNNAFDNNKNPKNYNDDYILSK